MAEIFGAPVFVCVYVGGGEGEAAVSSIFSCHGQGYVLDTLLKMYLPKEDNSSLTQPHTLLVYMI